jgi:hypothetical protein
MVGLVSFKPESFGKTKMRKPNAVLIGATCVTLALAASLAALKLSWDTYQRVEAEFGKNRYKATYRTDEQAAQEYKPDGLPVFQDLTEEQIARRALSALCSQMQCANLKHYVYSFERDGSSAAGAFWYRPADPQLAEPARQHEHFMCRFRNEKWVICHVGSRKGPEVDMVFARALPESFMKERDLDKNVELRERIFPESN